MTGFIRMSEAVPDAKPTESQGYTQVTGMSTKQISEATGEDLAADYVQLDSESVDRLNGMAGGGAEGGGAGGSGAEDGGDAGAGEGAGSDGAGASGDTGNGDDGDAPDLQALPLPHLDGGTNLSYGIQWIAFGILAPVGLGWFVYAEMRERRREREESAEVARLNAQITDGAGDGDAGAGAADGTAGGGGEGAGAGGDAGGSSSASSADTAHGEEAAGSAAANPKPADIEKPKPTGAEKSLNRGNGTPAEKKKPRKRSDLTDRYGGTRSRFEERRAEKRGRERF